VGSTCSTAFPQRTMESRLYENAMVRSRWQQFCRPLRFLELGRHTAVL
jgi:hypothetical protein